MHRRLPEQPAKKQIAKKILLKKNIHFKKIFCAQEIDPARWEFLQTGSAIGFSAVDCH